MVLHDESVSGGPCIETSRSMDVHQPARVGCSQYCGVATSTLFEGSL